MEARINKVIEAYLTTFKDDIRTKITNIGFSDQQKMAELVEYVYDYDRLCLTKTDFVKRKRIKNSIPALNRCNAKRANGEQCTRRRKDEFEFCGTHSKGTPHGLIQEGCDAETNLQKVEVFAEDIQGIVYYIDNFNNVYKTEDILSNVKNPKIVAIAKSVENNGISTRILQSLPEL
jgi:hypothetical protein